MGRVCGFSTVVLQPTFHTKSKIGGAAVFQIHGTTVGIQLSGIYVLMIQAHFIFLWKCIKEIIYAMEVQHRVDVVNHIMVATTQCSQVVHIKESRCHCEVGN
jgi:hypothetical protein